jgi:O-antigen biosynthesis protein WbqP
LTYKRTFDLVIGIPAAILSVPIMVVIGTAIALFDGRPILLRQDRVGKNERVFSMFKFRTMAVGVRTVAKSDLTSADAVYTRLGPLLRRSSLDELPQIANVLTGSMSLIGPRPALPSQHDLLELRRRKGIEVLPPGITGLAQVKGRESLTLPTKTRFEALYLRRNSRRLDLVILIWTVRAVFRSRGTY